MALRIGVDSGGTFTDICLIDDQAGRLQIWKVPSTPRDPSEGIAEAIAQGLAQVGGRAADVAYFGHGTTVGTNALIQHRGATTALVTSDGFRDLLEIGRQKRPDLYDMNVDKPEPLVPRDRRLGIAERMLHDGRVETPLDEEAVRRAAREFREAGVKAVAICFLYGFAYSEHEARAREIFKEEFPEAFVSTSHGVAPEFREYERMSSTVVNAYLGPVMYGYIERLKHRLDGFGIRAVPHITQSNGGVLGLEAAAEYPVRTVLSGPSTGVVAAQAIGRLAGMNNLITFDMGGTSTDTALITDGICRLTNEAIVEGYPIKAPMLDIHTVGAGGGSIAHVDSGGLLKVGPRSAGADPGPACYGRGNYEPTVTDANLVLGNLNQTHLLAGRMPIEHGLAVKAIEGVAGKLGMPAMRTAEGILSVVIANMAKAIRVISVQRGYDPRDYTLIAFGGAGPLHAARLARELDMAQVLIPLTPGALCATGLLYTDLRVDFSVTNLMQLAPDAAAAASVTVEGLEARAQAWFEGEGIAPAARQIRRTVDMRYRGQNHEIAVALPEGKLDAAALAVIAKSFADAHDRAYGFASGGAIELVTFRLEAVGLVDKVEPTAEPEAGTDASAAIVGSRRIWSDETDGFLDCPLYDRDRLKPGNSFVGPAIVEQMDTTTVVPTGASVRVDPYRNLIMDVSR
ncbi:hydantoinase/oxoprolinase family protein [Devosia sp.]|jgi:N-methylhydantoinase A|uniref:hydantoinase/oxoprolinase family protein n=1 Tax=Devosia sp. TaxID=1871048 RepID=UPI0035B07E96